MKKAKIKAYADKYKELSEGYKYKK